jgi:hypothetical protein
MDARVNGTTCDMAVDDFGKVEKSRRKKKGVPNFETPNSLEILKATCARQRTA